MISLKDKIVRLKNGQIGIVTSFNGIPTHIIFKAFSNPLTQWNENGKHKHNSNYDIQDIFDSTNLDKITDIWLKRFDFSKYQKIN